MAYKPKAKKSEPVDIMAPVNAPVLPLKDSNLDLIKQLSKELSYDATGRESATEFISTSSVVLDTIIANQVGGGIPKGRLIELSGDESCVTEDTLIEIQIDS